MPSRLACKTIDKPLFLHRIRYTKLFEAAKIHVEIMPEIHVLFEHGF